MRTRELTSPLFLICQFSRRRAKADKMLAIEIVIAALKRGLPCEIDTYLVVKLYSRLLIYWFSYGEGT